jgi:hypothetical protein
VRLEGASGLGAKDLTKHAAVCLVKLCDEHAPHFDNRCDPRPQMFEEQSVGF